MSPKKTVDKLSVLCLKIITTLTLDTLKIHGEKCVEKLKNYFEKLPQILCDAILVSIFDITSLSSFSKFITFSIFKYRCSKFDCRTLSSKYHERLAENLTNVVYLNLTDAQINERTLKRLIRRCPNLRLLVIPNKATDKIIKEVRNLSKLELLDISSNVELSVEGLSYLNNKSLKVLSISTTLNGSEAHYESYDTLANILQQLPNLTEIRAYEYTGRALPKLKKPYVSKLRVITDYETCLEHIVAIIGVCPLLEELTLKDPQNDIFEHLVELRELKKLKVSKSREGPLILELKSLTLQSLEVKGVTVDLGNLCITLENLLAQSCFICNNLNMDMRFKNLRVIEFIDCNVTRNFVMPLLEFCDKLQRLAVSNDIGLTDLDVRVLCQNQKLKCLEELWLSLAKNLTSDSVILLMNHCDKLRVLGTLNGWNIEKVEVNYLRCVIYFTNTNLTLLHFSCF